MRCALALLAVLVAAAPAAAAQSIYTSLEDCKVLEEVEEGSFARLACPAPEGWGVEIVDFDGRSFLLLQNAGAEYSLEREMVQDFPFGQFPAVGKKAEWRLGPDGPRGLIVRMHYMKDDAPRSILFVFRVGNGPPRLLGSTTSNEQARQIADQP